MDPQPTKPDTPLDNALDLMAGLQDLEQKLPRRTLAQLATVGVIVAFKEVLGELDRDQPKRRKAA